MLICGHKQTLQGKTCYRFFLVQADQCRRYCCLDSCRHLQILQLERLCNLLQFCLAQYHEKFQSVPVCFVQGFIWCTGIQLPHTDRTYNSSVRYCMTTVILSACSRHNCEVAGALSKYFRKKSASLGTDCDAGSGIAAIGSSRRENGGTEEA